MDADKNILQGKHIILGITGSIAAYKAILLLRLLVTKGATVQVILTKEAAAFVSLLTLSTLSGRPALVHYVNQETGLWHNHVELGSQADMMLIAPTSANTLAKAAIGMCDNLLMAVYLSARCPVWLMPAMDLEMYAHPAVQQNLEILAKRAGNRILEAQSGYLASGLHGKGRMIEPENIVQLLEIHFELQAAPNTQTYKGTALITAGPTHEPIDPVRFISNHSSGKMGFALAEALALKGYQVILITGPVILKTSHPNINRIDITTAAQMLDHCLKYIHADIKIFAAAVADYRPQTTQTHKIKKQTDQDPYNLVLEKTPDIALSLKDYNTNINQKPCFHLGFALETHNQFDFAKQKLESKGFDAIVLNTPSEAGSGFGYDTNEVFLISHTQTEPIHFPLQTKHQLAQKLADYADTELNKKRNKLN